MFGSDRKDTRAAGALADAEIGVMSYVLLKLLSQTAELGWPDLELTEAESDTGIWKSKLLESTHIYSFDVGIGIGGRGGIARIAVPLSLLDFAPLTPSNWSLPAQLSELTRRFDA